MKEPQNLLQVISSVKDKLSPSASIQFKKMFWLFPWSSRTEPYDQMVNATTLLSLGNKEIDYTKKVNIFRQNCGF